MQAVLRVDAAPGFEDAVEAQLRFTKGVQQVARHKDGNYDFVLLVDVPDAGELQRMIANHVRTVSGVKSVEHVREPEPAVRGKLGMLQG